MKRKTIDQIVYTAAVAALLIAAAPMRAMESDEAIEASLRQTYVYRTYLNDDTIDVATKDGVVTLTGKVADKSHRNLAQDTAESLAGVVRVDNQLETQAEADADNADVWMSKKIKLALLLHRNVSIANTTVESENGIVTLTGTATSMAQKELTGKFASNVDGVVAVMNQMTVVEIPEPGERTQGEKLDDSSVTAMVRAVLVNHGSINALNTKVETRNGKVMLTGIAENDAEKALFTELIGDIHGVTSVRNQMTVKNVITK